MEDRLRSGDEVASARADVEVARTRLTETTDTLQERLQPRSIGREAGNQAQGAARNLGQELIGAVRRKPLVGVVWGAVLGLLFLRLIRR